MNYKFVFAILLIASTIHAKRLPKKFYGKYVLDHSVLFDEYLEAKGYDPFLREIIVSARFDKEFKKSKKPGKFDYSNLSSLRDISYKDIELGKEFIDEAMDFSMNKIMFDLKGNVLLERYIRIEDGEPTQEDTFEYSFVKKRGKEYLRLKMTAGDIVAKRYYKRA